MKKRVNSFIMTILMVLTILPTNFITVGAESDCKIYLKVYNLEESVLDSKKFNVDVTNEDETIVDSISRLSDSPERQTCKDLYCLQIFSVFQVTGSASGVHPGSPWFWRNF